MRNASFLFLLLAMMLSAKAQAFDEGGLAYTITSSISPFTVNVTGRASGNSATEISIPDTVTSNGITYGVTAIVDSAFRSNALISVTIGDSVTTIGNQAFAFNNALASVTIGSSVNTIGTQAFYFNDLTSMTISDSVTTIGDQAFAFNNALTTLTIGSSVTTIGVRAFYDNDLSHLTIGNSVETIENEAFWNNTSLTSLTIPDSVTTVGDKAFGSNTSLTSVAFLGNFGAFNLNMFTGNSNLTTITYVQGKTGWPQTFTPAGPGSVAAIPSTFEHTVSLNGQSVTIDLQSYSVRGPNFAVLVQETGGAFRSHTPPSPSTYLGSVREHPGATAAAIIRADGRVFSRISFEDGVEWFSAGATTRVRGQGDADFIMWPSIPVLPSGAGSEIYAAEVGADTDSTYVNEAGGVAAALEILEYSVLATNQIYLRDVGITHLLERVIIRADASSDPYLNDMTGREVFDEVARQWRSVLPTGKQDMAMFATTRKGGGGLGTIGAVGSNAITTNAPVESDGFEEGDISVVWRHEAGHNWNVRHFEGGVTSGSDLTGPEGKTIMSGNTLAKLSVSEAAVILAFKSTVLDKLDNLGSFGLPLPPRASVDRLYYVDGVNDTFDVLLNDHDGNGETFALSSFDSVSALGGTLTRSVGTGPNGRDKILYTPPSGGLGNVIDNFYYRITDSSGQQGLGRAVVRELTAAASSGPAAYSQTTSNGQLVIADTLGGDDDLELTQVSQNLWMLTADGKSLTSDGNNFFEALFVDMQIAEPLKIQLGAGLDTVRVEGSSEGTLSRPLIIDGGAGDDEVIFSGAINVEDGAYIDLNLQDDDASPGKDRVTFNGGAKVAALGNARIDVKVSQSVLVDSGSSVTATHGEITIEANRQGGQTTSGDFSGVVVKGSIATSGQGSILISGRGGDGGIDAKGYQTGVKVEGSIVGGSAGQLVVKGLGGNSANIVNAGVDIRGKITSAGAPITIEALAGPANTYYGIGLRMPYGGEVRAGGTGNLAIKATGAGDSCCKHDAVELRGGSALTAVSGDVRLELESGPGSVGLAARDDWEVGSAMGDLHLTDAGLSVSNGNLLGDVQFQTGAKLLVNFNGETVNSLDIAGSIDLTGLQLDIAGSSAPEPDTTLTLIDNQGTSPIWGVFDGLPAGSAVDIEEVRLMIIYNGGDGNDSQLIEFKDADSDGLSDILDSDDDNDGVLDVNDEFPFNGAEDKDSDGDGIGNNADPDDDNDGLSDVVEIELGTDPLRRDTDGDGWSDKEEVNEGTDPLLTSSRPEPSTGLPAWLLYQATQ